MENSSFEVLTAEECERELRQASVGRIAFVHAGRPVVLPINYRVIGDANLELVLRTREGNLIDDAPAEVAFEIDDIDPAHHTGWSVLVQGNLRQVSIEHIQGASALDPEPWLAGRDAWLVLDPTAITGRRIVAGDTAWPIDPRSYL